jgi:hypothetical protein
VKSAQEAYDAAYNEVRVTETKLFAADKKINDYLDDIDNPQLAIAMKIEIDKER